MEAERPEAPPEEERAASFTRGDEEWIARIAGRGSSGTSRDGGAPLLALVFAAATDPEKPLREVVCVGRGLGELTKDELVMLLERSRPYRGGGERAELFAETRVRRKDR